LIEVVEQKLRVEVEVVEVEVRAMVTDKDSRRVIGILMQVDGLENCLEIILVEDSINRSNLEER